MISQNPKINLDDVYQEWGKYGLVYLLQSESSIKEPIIPASPEAVDHLKNFMTASWSVMEKVQYIRGFVFAKSGLFPASLHEAFHIMTSYFGLGKWDPSASVRVEPTEENIAIIIEEKKQAILEVEQLRLILKPEKLGLPSEMVSLLEEMLDLYVYYVRALFHCTRTCFLAKLVTITGKPSDKAILSTYITEMGLFIR
jgi:hypothetical protein